MTSRTVNSPGVPARANEAAMALDLFTLVPREPTDVREAGCPPVARCDVSLDLCDRIAEVSPRRARRRNRAPNRRAPESGSESGSGIGLRIGLRNRAPNRAQCTSRRNLDFRTPRGRPGSVLWTDCPFFYLKKFCTRSYESSSWI